MVEGLVSVIIPCYNHELYVKDTIQSVINQTYKKIELIIIDDGSRDNSVDIISQFQAECKHRFVNFEFRSRENKGLSKTLNEALDWCDGEYLSVLASDDIYLENKIEKQVHCLKKNLDLSGVSSNVSIIDENGKIIKSKIVKSKIYDFNDIFLSQYYLPAPSAMLRLCLVKKIGGYDENTLLEDLFMWLKISEFGGLYLMEDVLVYYRRHSLNLSGNFLLMCDERYKLINLFRDKENYNRAILNVSWINFKGSRFYGLMNIFKMSINFIFSLIKFLNK